jgi:hypothetical protein
MIVLKSRPRAGPDRRPSMACRSKARFAPIRCRSPIRRSSRAPRAAREAGCELPARRSSSTSRERLKPSSPSWRPRATAHGRESARQWRHPAARPAHAGFPRLCRRVVPIPGFAGHRRHPCAGAFPARCGEAQQQQRNFRVFGPDETLSNGLEARVRGYQPPVGGRDREPSDEFLAPGGRVMEMLSEHQCEGWLEGYLLTGGMACSTATRPSSTSSIRCSTSTPNG